MWNVDKGFDLCSTASISQKKFLTPPVLPFNEATLRLWTDEPVSLTLVLEEGKTELSAILPISAGVRGVKNSIAVLVFGEHFTTIRLKTSRNWSVSMNLNHSHGVWSVMKLKGWSSVWPRQICFKTLVNSLSVSFCTDLYWPHCEIWSCRWRWASTIRRWANLCGWNGCCGKIPSASRSTHATSRKTGSREPDCETQDWIWM